MNHQLLIDAFARANKLCKVWLFSFISGIFLLVVCAVSASLGWVVVFYVAIVFGLFGLLGLMVLFVLEVVWSITLVSDFSAILTMFSDPLSEEYRSIKVFKNIVIAIWVCYVLGLFLGLPFFGVLILKFIFFTKFKKFKLIRGL